MMIKAGVWNNLSSKEKMGLLVHFSYHNPMKPASIEKDRTAMRSVEKVQKIS